MSYQKLINLLLQELEKSKRFLSQPFFVAEVFTGSPGKYVELKDTIAGFKGILEGKYDNVPKWHSIWLVELMKF